MSRFINADRTTPYWLPPSVQDWLPEGHMARFVAEIVGATGFNGNGTTIRRLPICGPPSWDPDHDTLATFRRRFLPQVEKLFVQVLEIAHEMKLAKLGQIALDGTKIKASASKHNALS